jgi:hypothetical protein
MEVTKMSDETKTVAVATAPAPATAPAAQTAAQPTMAQVMHDPNAPIMTMKKFSKPVSISDIRLAVGIRRWAVSSMEPAMAYTSSI